jgi:PAS domain S-box-containing protein
MTRTRRRFNWLSWVVAPVVVVAIGVLASVEYQKATKRAVNSFEQLQDSIAQNAAGRIEEYFRHQEIALLCLANDAMVQNYGPIELQPLMEHETTIGILDLIRFRQNGGVLARLSDGPAVDAPKYWPELLEWVRDPDHRDQTYFGPVVRPESGPFRGRSLQAMARPVYRMATASGRPNSSGHFTGFLVLIVDLDTVVSQFLSRAKLPPGSTSWVISSEGLYLVFADKTQGQPARNPSGFSGSPAVEAPSQINPDTGVRLRATTHLVSQAPLRVGEEAWSLWLSTPRSQVMASVVGRAQVHIGLLVGLALLIALAGVLHHFSELRRTELERQAELLALKNRHHAELAASEERYRSLVRAARDGIVSLDDQGRITFVSPQMTKLTGYAEEQLLGQPLESFIHPEDRACLRERIELRFSTESAAEGCDLRLFRADGSVLYVSLVLGVVEAEDGSAEMVGFVRDMTERKLAEAALQESKARYRTVLNRTMDAIVASDENGNIIEFNNSAEAMFGFRRDEVLGKSVGILMPDSMAKRHDGYMHRYLKTGKTQAIGRGREQTGRRKNGEEFPLELLLSEDVLDGRRIFIATMRDLTERKLLEAQLQQSQKMEAIGTLAGGIAHDFNNLLTGIMGYTDFVKTELGDDHPLAEYVNEIDRAASRAAALTRQLLAFSRRQILEISHVDLNHVVESVVGFLERVIGEHIELKVRRSPDALMAQVDAGQIEQVLMNLCVNARDAMKEGGQLSIETSLVMLDEEFCEKEPWARPGKYVKLVVSDTGVGMSPEVLERIFEPFFTTKEAGEGTGLGLAMVYGIIEQHKGLIHVESEPGRGSRFEVYLPATEVLQLESPEPTVVDSIQGGRETILVVEDEEVVRRVAQRTLEALGYEVLTAADTEEAIRLFEENSDRIDLIFTDMVLGSGSGKEIHLAVSHRKPEVRFLFTSGYTVNDDGTPYVLEPWMEFIGKPYDAIELGRKVRQVLDQREVESKAEST